MVKKSLILFVSFIFLISFASALEIDNIKEYDPVTREVTVYNSFLGIIKLDQVGKARLNTPLNVKVAVGYQKVAEFDLWAYEDYNDALKQFEFIDLETRKEISRDYDLKYLSYEEVEVNDYENDCKIIINFRCGVKLSGTHIEIRKKWNEITQVDLKKNDKLTIGVFTEVKEGDRVDWIPRIYGEKVPEWATWQQSLNTDLISGWNFDGSGNATDLLGANELFNSGLTTGEDGIINKSYLSDTSSDYLSKTTPTTPGNAFAFSFWANLTSAESDDMLLQMKQDAPNFAIEISFLASSTSLSIGKFDGSSDSDSTDYSPYFNNWTHIVFSYNGTRWFLWLNAINKINDTVSFGDFTSLDLIMVGNNPLALSRAINGNIDETYYWNRSLTQTDVNNLFGGGNPPFFNETGDNAPNITLNSPSSGNFTSPQSLNINFTASDDINLTDVKLYVNGLLNQTNATGINNSEYIFPLNLGDGNFTIFGLATDNESQTSNSSSILISIDSQVPTINIESPNGTIEYFLLGNNETLNVTVTDTSLESCWYNYNGTNVTIQNCLSGIKNSTEFIYELGNNNITVYANDSLGNLNSSFRSWDYIILESNRTFNNQTYEGSQETFSTEITIGGGQSLSQAILEYNNTNYTTNIIFISETYFISSTISVPTVTTDTNISFGFYLVIDGITYFLGSENQTILNVELGACGGGDDLLINISLFDEGTRTNITGNIELNAQIIGKVNGNIVQSANLTFTSVNYGEVCLTPNASLSSFYLDMEIKYVSADHAPELYNIQKADLSDYPKNLSLFDLALNDSTEFLIKYEDDDLILVEGAVIQLQRKYIGSDLFEVVEAPTTSNLGTAVVHIDLNTNKYQATIVKDGVVLDIFTNIVFHCENELSGQCTEELLGKIDSQNIVTLESLNDFTYAVSEVNNTITTLFSIPSGSPSSINIVLTQTDVFGNTSLCNQTVVSSAGSIDCTYSDTIGDSVVQLEIRKDEEPQAIKSYVIYEDGTLDFSGNNFFILLIMALSLIGMAFSSPEWIVINSVIILLLGGSLWLLDGMNLVIGLGSLVWLVVGAGILIKEISKQEDR